jgi:hypothetical protein
MGLLAGIEILVKGKGLCGVGLQRHGNLWWMCNRQFGTYEYVVDPQRAEFMLRRVGRGLDPSHPAGEYGSAGCGTSNSI